VATAIKETPVLRGKNADKFLREVRENETRSSAYKADSQRAKKLYAKMKKATGFCL